MITNVVSRLGLALISIGLGACAEQLQPTLEQVPGQLGSGGDGVSSDAQADRDSDASPPDATPPECQTTDDCVSFYPATCQLSVCTAEQRCDVVWDPACSCTPRTLWTRTFVADDPNDLTGITTSDQAPAWRIDRHVSASAPLALRFGNAWNSRLSTTNAPSGTVLGRPIVLPTDAGPVHLRFRVRLDARDDAAVDQVSIAFITPATGARHPAWNRSQLTDLPQLKWHDVDVTLPYALAGQPVQLEIRWESTEPWNGEVSGVAFDDFELISVCP